MAQKSTFNESLRLEAGCRQVLDLGKMGLETVHPAALHGLESLRLLSLSENRLEQLPERFLEPVPNLRKLLLGGSILWMEIGWRNSLRSSSPTHQT